MLWNSAVSDSLDHGGVVARVRKNFAAWKKIGDINFQFLPPVGWCLKTALSLALYGSFTLVKFVRETG